MCEAKKYCANNGHDIIGSTPDEAASLPSMEFTKHAKAEKGLGFKVE